MAKRATIEDVRPVLTEFDKVVDATDAAIDKVESSIDTGVEAVEHVVETGVHAAAVGGHKAVHFLRSPKMAAIVVFTCGVAGAGYVGWKLSQRHHAKKFDTELAKEIEAARSFYARMNKAGEFSTPEEAAKTLHAVTPEEDVHILKAEEATEALKSYQGKTDYNKVVKDKVTEKVAADIDAAIPEVTKSNVFVNGKPLDPNEFNYEAELANRSEDEPYVITFEEFAMNESDNAQMTITYYEGDDTLAGEDDELLGNLEATIGSDNLTRFGNGSNDPNVVYIRNERTKTDFEVTRSTGKYAEEVAGFDSPTPPRKAVRGERFRGEDG